MDCKMLNNKKIMVASAVLLGLTTIGGTSAVLVNNNNQTVQASNAGTKTGYYNIDEWGAQPNNPNFDNAKVFNRIISQMGKQGGTIYIPAGTYYVKSPVNIDRSYVSIVGDNSGLRSGIDRGDNKSQAGGGGAQVMLTSGVTGFKIRGGQTRLSGITFKGFQIKGQHNNGFGIKGETDTDGVIISDMVINNVGLGVELKGADAASIHNNWIAETKSSLKLSGSHCVTLTFIN